MQLFPKPLKFSNHVLFVHISKYRINSSIVKGAMDLSKVQGIARGKNSSKGTSFLGRLAGDGTE